jgi:hypothetical protein
VAFVAAGIWACYVFVYEQRLKPLAESPVLQSTVQVEHQRLAGENTLLTVIVDLKNIGAPAVQMDGTIVNVYGLKYGHLPDGRMVRTSTPNFGYVAPRGQPIAKQSLLVSLLFREKPFGGSERLTIDPGEDQLYYPHAVISSGGYDAVVVSYGYCFQRADNDASTVFAPRTGRDGGYEMPSASGSIALQGQNGVACSGYSDREFAL